VKKPFGVLTFCSFCKLIGGVLSFFPFFFGLNKKSRCFFFSCVRKRFSTDGKVVPLNLRFRSFVLGWVVLSLRP